MSSINKSLLRLAVAIHSQLASHGGHDRVAELPKSSWECCTGLVAKIRRAELRGWQLAAAELRRDLAYMISSVQSELTAIASQLSALTPARPMATVGDVYEDLLTLEDDFDEVEFDIRDHRLSVTTEPITLQNVYLGPFEIQLDWGRTRDDSAYRVIASEPQPPESRENVTHPHVMDDRLCEGHSRHAIRQALVQGRLLDFFMLVANGLRTYNEESPFVALEVWFGVSCADCGALMDEDERYVCQKCEETICSGCEAMCGGCDDSCCSQCITCCAACDDNFCQGCLKPCKECRSSVCSGCLQDDERCSSCHEKDQNNTTNPAPDRATVQPIRMGQTAVPA